MIAQLHKETFLKAGGAIAKSIHPYNAYNPCMAAVKRIPVTEKVWKDLADILRQARPIQISWQR
jgi:hypothetical protein